MNWYESYLSPVCTYPPFVRVLKLRMFVEEVHEHRLSAARGAPDVQTGHKRRGALGDGGVADGTINSSNAPKGGRWVIPLALLRVREDVVQMS